MNIKLKNINKNDFDNIYKIVSQKEIMKFIGNGNIWDKEKTHRFINYCLQEQKLPDSKRENYYYKIVSNKLVGIIGFHPFINFKGYFLTIYLDTNEQGKGYFSKSLNLLIDKVKTHKPNITHILSLVNEKNSKMNIISKFKFKFEKKIKIKNKFFNQYRIDIH